MHLRCRDQFHVPHADVAEIALLVLEPAALKCLVDVPKGRLVDGALPEALPLRQERARELREGEGLRVALTHVGQHVRDVVAKHRVRRDEEHVLGAEALAVLVEQVCDALEQHRRLARTRDAGDEQHGAVLVADDGVLLLLDGRGDRLHLGGALFGQRREKQRILDGDVGVEIGAQLVAHDVELAAQREVDGDRAAVRAVVRGTHVLVVVHLGDGRAPVDHEAPTAVVRYARSSDVELLRRGAAFEVEDDLREVRLSQKQADIGELLGGGVLRLVVRVDDAVHGREVGVGLERLGVAAVVLLDFLHHLLFRGGSRILVLAHLGRKRARHRPQRCIGVA